MPPPQLEPELFGEYGVWDESETNQMLANQQFPLPYSPNMPRPPSGGRLRVTKEVRKARTARTTRNGWHPWQLGSLHNARTYVQDSNKRMQQSYACQLRHTLRAHPMIREPIHRLWGVLDRVKEADGTLSREAYLHEHSKIAQVLAPRNPDYFQEAGAEDWERDLTLGFEPRSGLRAAPKPPPMAPRIDSRQFARSLFELADLWCRTTDPAEYNSFLCMVDRHNGAEHREAYRRINMQQALEAEERRRAEAQIEAERLAAERLAAERRRLEEEELKRLAKEKKRQEAEEERRRQAEAEAAASAEAERRRQERIQRIKDLEDERLREERERALMAAEDDFSERQAAREYSNLAEAFNARSSIRGGRMAVRTTLLKEERSRG